MATLEQKVDHLIHVVGASIGTDARHPDDIAADVEAAAEDEQNQPEPATETEESDEVNATPGAIEYANELGIDITTVEGTGSGGQVTKDDVAKAESALKAEEAAAS